MPFLFSPYSVHSAIQTETETETELETIHTNGDTSDDNSVIAENKRKGDDGLENPTAKTKRVEKRKCSDLIVLGLPWKSSEVSFLFPFMKVDHWTWSMVHLIHQHLLTKLILLYLYYNI